MLSTSVLLYFLQPGGEDGDSEEDFSSIPATFYLSVLMLTGQGVPEGALPWYTARIETTERAWPLLWPLPLPWRLAALTPNATCLFFPLPGPQKLVVAITAVFSVAIFAIPASMLTYVVAGVLRCAARAGCV